MKKLLTTITLSALVGTSAGNLKPVFTIFSANIGFKSNQLNKEISNRSKNDNPFISKVNNLAGIIFNSSNGIFIWVFLMVYINLLIMVLISKKYLI